MRPGASKRTPRPLKHGGGAREVESRRSHESAIRGRRQEGTNQKCKLRKTPALQLPVSSIRQVVKLAKQAWGSGLFVFRYCISQIPGDG